MIENKSTKESKTFGAKKVVFNHINDSLGGISLHSNYLNDVVAYYEPLGIVEGFYDTKVHLLMENHKNGFEIVLHNATENEKVTDLLVKYYEEKISKLNLNNFEFYTLISSLQELQSNVPVLVNVEFDILDIDSNGKIKSDFKYNVNTENADDLFEQALFRLNDVYASKNLYYVKMPEVNLKSMYLKVVFKLNNKQPEKVQYSEDFLKTIELPEKFQSRLEEYKTTELLLNKPDFLDIDSKYGFVFKIADEEYLVTPKYVLNQTTKRICNFSKYNMLQDGLHYVAKHIFKGTERNPVRERVFLNNLSEIYTTAKDSRRKLKQIDLNN